MKFANSVIFTANENKLIYTGFSEVTLVFHFVAKLIALHAYLKAQ